MDRGDRGRRQDRGRVVARPATLAPAVVAKHRKKWLAAVRRLLGDRLSAEVFALDGLTVDTPSMAVLRKRIGALVERFAG